MALSREQGGDGAGGSEAGPGGAARSDEHPGDAGVHSGKKPVGSAAVPAADWYRAREQRRPGREVALGGAAGGSPGERALQEQRRSGLNTETSN